MRLTSRRRVTSLPVIDATALINIERRPDAFAGFIAALRADGEPLVVPIQAAIEFSSGMTDPAEAMRKVRQAFTVVPMGPDIALEAARIAKHAHRTGTFPGWADIQIAATALHEGMAVVSNNRSHFEPLGLEVIEHP